MKIVSYRSQRTISRAAEVRGVGYLTGKAIRLQFAPAPVNTGVVFVRTDLGGASVAANVQNVTGTHRRTTIGDGVLGVGLVEHVLSALAGLSIDNCRVELDAPEPPGLDGSARGFVDALLQAGMTLQPAKRPIWAPASPLIVEHGDATLTLHPPTELELRVSYFLDYGLGSPIDRQVFTADIHPESFINQIACCRTFVLEQEAHQLRQQGIGLKTQATDLLVFGPRGPINNQLRFANEPARHKVLDLVGDLSLSGQLICGHVVGCRSGHPLNVELAREIHERTTAANCYRYRSAA